MEWIIDLTSLFDDNLIYTDKLTVVNHTTTLGFHLANLWEATIQTPFVSTFACFLFVLVFCFCFVCLSSLRRGYLWEWRERRETRAGKQRQESAGL